MKPFKFILVALTVFAVSSCMKDDDTPQFDEKAWEEQLEKDKVIIKAHVAEHYPNMIEDEFKRGYWYEILQEGDSESYTYKINETINQYIYPIATVRYKGQLLNGTIFDQNDTESGVKMQIIYDPYGRGGVIQAFMTAFFPQKIDNTEVGGLTEDGLKTGSKIRFITPSGFAYGNRQTGTIPPNSPLIFEVTVLDITDTP